MTEIEDRDDIYELMERERVLLNERLAHIALPLGARLAYDWSATRHTDNDANRIVGWSDHHTQMSTIAVEGLQDITGAVSNYIAAHVETVLTADQAREIAAALQGAADALDALR